MISLDAMPIELSNGAGYAWVDREDWATASSIPWHIQVTTRTGQPYACTTARDLKRHGLSLHRFVSIRIGLDLSRKIDHVDRNGLNNTRRNLRVATSSQNSANTVPPKNNKSGFKGVSWIARDKSWRSQITVRGYKRNMGFFATPEAAARVYDEWAKMAFGTFAWLNFEQRDK